MSRRSRMHGWRRKPVGVIVADIWRQGLGPCAVCRFEGTPCKGRVHAHRVIPRGTLIREGLSEHVMDKRNRLAVCASRHDAHHNGSAPIPRRLLPDPVFEFAAELGLGWYLDRHYPEEAAA